MWWHLLIIGCNFQMFECLIYHRFFEINHRNHCPTNSLLFSSQNQWCIQSVQYAETSKDASLLKYSTFSIPTKSALKRVLPYFFWSIVNMIWHKSSKSYLGFQSQSCLALESSRDCGQLSAENHCSDFLHTYQIVIDYRFFVCHPVCMLSGNRVQTCECFPPVLADWNWLRLRYKSFVSDTFQALPLCRPTTEDSRRCTSSEVWCQHLDSTQTSHTAGPRGIWKRHSQWFHRPGLCPPISLPENVGTGNPDQTYDCNTRNKFLLTLCQLMSNQQILRRWVLRALWTRRK